MFPEERPLTSRKSYLSVTLLVSLVVSHYVGLLCKAWELDILTSSSSYFAALVVPLIIRHVFFDVGDEDKPVSSRRTYVSRLPVTHG